MRIYVMAGRHEQARTFAHERGFGGRSFVFVSDRHQVMGLRGITLYVLETAEQLQDYDFIMQEAAIREFEIKRV